MTALDRTYRILAVGQPDNGQFFAEQGNAVEITGLDIRATIEKSIRSSPNKAEIEIFNLWEDSRVFFDQRPLRVYLEAGYAGENRLLFVGDVRPGSGSLHDGTEWITKLVLRDGGRAFSAARVNRSYKPGTPLLSIVRDAARSMGLDVPREIATDSDFAAKTTSGETLSGYTADELTRILAPYGYSWSIQNGKLQALRDEQSLPGVARVIEQPPVGGMIGTPKMNVPQPSRAKKPRKSKKRPHVEIQHLLDGTIVPGMRIQLRAAVLADFFKITKVKHVLDLRGEDWNTDMEGIPV